MLELKIEDVVYREDLYPRFKRNPKVIQQYSETIEQLPPIIVNQDNILVDGFHRLKAHQKEQKETIEAEVLNLTEREVYFESIKRNSKHGLQLNADEKKHIAIELCGVIPDAEIRAMLSVPDSTYASWTKNKKIEQKKEQEDKILGLWLACYSTREIAELVGVDHQTVINVANKSNMGESSHIPTDFKPQLYNIWNFAKNTNEIKHPGNIPHEIVENLLYYYTEPLDIVYDPFAGGGVTIDACKQWMRRYYVSDIAPISERDDEIRQHDITNGVPIKILKNLAKDGIKLVFLDPPYWKQKEGDYTDEATDFSKMPLDRYYESMGQLFEQSKSVLCDGGFLAVIVGHSQKDMKIYDHAFKFYEMLTENYAFENRIVVPYNTQQVIPADVAMAKKKRMMLKLYRDLLIFKKTV